MKLTPLQINKIAQAIGETKIILKKEMSYREDLQKKEMVAEYEAHIEKLEKMLSDFWEELAA